MVSYVNQFCFYFCAGGSESFKDKREHFKKSLEQHCHRNEYHTGQSTSMAITVKRDTLVDSSMSALSRKDYWSKLLVITFQGEQGKKHNLTQMGHRMQNFKKENCLL